MTMDLEGVATALVADAERRLQLAERAVTEAKAAHARELEDDRAGFRVSADPHGPWELPPPHLRREVTAAAIERAKREQAEATEAVAAAKATLAAVRRCPDSVEVSAALANLANIDAQLSSSASRAIRQLQDQIGDHRQASARVAQLVGRLPPPVRGLISSALTWGGDAPAEVQLLRFLDQRIATRIP